jgi:isoleucyl-tRNA synthetase
MDIMESVRSVVSVGLEARAVSGLKVRQPLQSILVIGANKKIDKKYFDIIKDELNIKEIFFEDNLESAKQSNKKEFFDDIENITENDQDNIIVILNKSISDELQKEGDYREFLRQIQIMRKKTGLKVEDRIELKLDLNGNEKDFIEDFKKDLEKTAGVKNINYSKVSDGDLVKINKKEIKIILIEV